MDQGVIKATKAYYRASVVRRYIDAVEKGKGAPNISVLDAMTNLTRAWNKVTPETIKNCFKKAGICTGGPSSSCVSYDTLRNSGQSEIIRVCMGIFTICFRKHKYYKILNKNTLSCFHGVLLAGCALAFPICDDFCEF